MEDFIIVDIDEGLIKDALIDKISGGTFDDAKKEALGKLLDETIEVINNDKSGGINLMKGAVLSSVVEYILKDHYENKI